ncbi:MAG TPA: putative sulfate exporter family transporter [Clostridia bacterium]|nr:putative sulfate exporter family transporter [Clostridia bacterium]
MHSKLLFLIGVLFAVSPWASPPLALGAGLIFGFVATHPYAKESRKGSRWLLQASVVGLGFGMNLSQVLRAGRSGIAYTAVGIAFALTLGWALGRMMNVHPRAAFLISTGTAICGGSAIAAVGPITGATEDEMSVSLGTVFILNSVALIIFPIIGTAMGLTQQQFGLWAALAIHDTSSVVGATAKFGAVALAVGTTVKLARALWIIPVSLGVAALQRRKACSAETGARAGVQVPWFIFLFVLAAVVNSYATAGAQVWSALYHAGRIGLTLTLFLIGASLSPAQIKRVGVRPLLQGIVLWLIVGALGLALIRGGWVQL